jgi:hypothetical protein
MKPAGTASKGSARRIFLSFPFPVSHIVHLLSLKFCDAKAGAAVQRHFIVPELAKGS